MKSALSYPPGEVKKEMRQPIVFISAAIGLDPVRERFGDTALRCFNN
jgi:hypothetical protein